MSLEGVTKEDMIIVEAGRKVAVALGSALYYTFRTDSLDDRNGAWQQLADEVSSFIMLTDK